MEFYIIAKGSILNKIRFRYREFRQYLKNIENILKSIESKQENILRQLIDIPCIDFSLMLSQHILENTNFHEYDICFEMIRMAKRVNNYYAFELMVAKGLSQEFLEFAFKKLDKKIVYI